MHVRAETSLTPEEVRARFSTLAPAGGAPSPPLRYDAARQPPKFFLEASPVTLPPAAEVAVQGNGSGSSVVLRLMWGPLPAPFPRAVAGAGVLAALTLLAVMGPSVGSSPLAALAAGLPAAALWIQRRGERLLQAQLVRVLGSGPFEPQPH
jgi:hypothetical protein